MDKLVKIISIIFGLCFPFLSYYIYSLLHKDPLDAFQYSILVAPALTFTIGWLTCLEQIRSFRLLGEKIVLLNIMALLIISGACILLSVFWNPVYHVTIVFILFSFFLLWDYLTIKWLRDSNNYEAQRRRIDAAHHLINWPTWIGFIIIFLFIAFYRWHVAENSMESNTFIYILKIIFSQETTPQEEIFVSGAIAFHLTVTAGAFFTANFLDIG